ncbi:MAG: hypothetical protein C0502_00520 [Opitutus sp.]|nr:hypothetical protein [Opitutus sp.]
MAAQRLRPRHPTAKLINRMKNIHSTNSLLLAAAVSLGLAASAFAQTTAPAAEPAPAERGAGLLGQNYASLSYGFIDLDGTGVDADSFTLGFNRNVRDGLDAFLEYDYTQTDRVFGSRLRQHSLLAGARVFTNYQGIKPYAEAGVGWVWQEFGNNREDSFGWGAGVGAEIELSPVVAVTPFVRYTDLTEGSGNGTWDFGVKANVRLTDKFTVLGSVSRDDDQNMEYRVGVNFRY